MNVDLVQEPQERVLINIGDNVEVNDNAGVLINEAHFDEIEFDGIPEDNYFDNLMNYFNINDPAGVATELIFTLAGVISTQVAVFLYNFFS